MNEQKTPLRRRRETWGLSLRHVALATDIDIGRLSQIERALVQATPRDAEKLARFFNEQVSELEVLYPERYAESA